MTNQNLGSKVSLAGKLKERLSWLLLGASALAVAALFAGSIAFGSSTAYAGEPTETPTVEPTAAPTETPPPGAMIFVGPIEVVEAEVCGGGNITLTLTPGDPGDGISAVSVAGFFANAVEANESFMFDPAVPIAGDGSFSDSAALPPPLDAINATIAGTFDFAADPATVAGTLTIGLVADPSVVLCEADFTAEALAAGAPTPTVPAPAPTAAATAVAAVPTALPVTGASVTPGAGGNGVLWAVVAGIAAVLALGAAGAATVRRQSGN